jgi:hypothetical protein
MPILAFLSATFVLLLVVRVVMSLLTAAVGIGLLLVFVVRLVTEVLVRPVRLVRTLHASPILSCTVLGVVFGAVRALWRDRFLPWWLDGWPGHDGDTVSTRHYLDSAAEDGTSIDLVMLWGSVQGLVYGIEMGCLWCCVLGDTSRPTCLARYFYHRVWRPLRRQYRRSANARRRPGRQDPRGLSVKDSSGRRGDGGGDDDDDHHYDDGRSGGDDRHQCVICLEPFDDTVGGAVQTGEGRDCRSGSLPDRYRLLPCRHCFHRECARHWLTIRRTCPICRVNVQGMEGCGSVEWTDDNNNHDDVDVDREGADNDDVDDGEDR